MPPDITCNTCHKLGIPCEYPTPEWWGDVSERMRVKAKISQQIRDKKADEKGSMVNCSASTPPGLIHSVPTSDTYSDSMAHTRAASVDSDYSGNGGLEFGHITPMSDLYDSYGPQAVTPGFGQQMPCFAGAPYEVDIRTERQMFVNDIPTRHDSSVSTFTTFQPPPPHSGFSQFACEDWVQEDYFESNHQAFPAEDGLDLDLFNFQHEIPPTEIPQMSQHQQALVEVADCDRAMLSHFIDNVAHLMFPMLEVTQPGSARTGVILPALESNKGYLHCCLSIAAIHMKSTTPVGVNTEQIDNDIVRHRYETISELCNAFSGDANQMQILEATLAMIFFQCSVGRPDDCLPDIPWHQHFLSATNLLGRLELPQVMQQNNTHPHFNMTLASWIDILGSTMTGRIPHFAAIYREKHLTGCPIGLKELMGCDDRLMYLISEIACLESLKMEGRIDDMQVCHHITALGHQFDVTEPAPGEISYPYSSTGTLMPRQLSRNMSACFRVAARVYMCSLVVGFDIYQPSACTLISKFVDLLEFIPTGPEGFDRSLVWPLLICGSFSTPESPLRAALRNRVTALGDAASFGSFGRVVSVLEEVWSQSAGPGPIIPEVPYIKSEPGCSPAQTPSAHHHQRQHSTPQIKPAELENKEEQKIAPLPSPSPAKRPFVHWRDVMQQKGWDFLLI